ncbi:MAG: glycoside hydrolase family 130 protein [Bacillota bacterium]
MVQRGALCVVATRRAEIRQADASRVITKLFIPGNEERVRRIIGRVLTLSEEDVSVLLGQVIDEFAHRHRRFQAVLEDNYRAVSHLVPEGGPLSEARRQLLGAYFTSEYSIQSAGVLNPSIVWHPDQSGLRQGEARYLLTYRCVGEGHISSLEFRSCVITSDYQIKTRPISPFLETPEWLPCETFSKSLLRARLVQRGAFSKEVEKFVDELPEEFSLGEVGALKERFETERTLPKRLRFELDDVLQWLQQSCYRVRFPHGTRISGRVLFPLVENECRGIEDARLVRFVDDDGEVTYYATYTGYNGFAITAKLLETKDFLSFKSVTLTGKAAQNKGMALFPRRVHGKYAMLCRRDNESNYVAFSDSLYAWDTDELIRGPVSPWEFVQIGNGGSPIETPAGWLVLTHGVGPMRKYCLGVDLLDLDDPSRLIGRASEPILSPNEYEREGYVPNVVYTCGAVVHRDELVIAYAMSDWASGIATVPLDMLLQSLS